ncbi:MAG: M48 family metalloprotease, partial [Polyangiaceae bacterium]|nr:M48 family metalloprotease [Polyangiaceae bacterium]
MSGLAAGSPHAPQPPRRKVVALDPESVRYGLERRLLDRVRAYEHFDRLAEGILSGFDAPRIRRELMASSLRLTESMAPDAHRMAAEAQALLDIEGRLEIYQSSGPENAAMHHHRDPILVEIQGRLLSLLDEPSMLSVLGHELGHYLAHGPRSELGRLMLAARVLSRAGQLPSDLVEVVSRMVVAAELTADRFGLLAAQDLDAALRAEMVATTGLAADALTWDTQAYLAQCRELMEACLAGTDETLSTTHPEHNLR